MKWGLAVSDSEIIYDVSGTDYGDGPYSGPYRCPTSVYKSLYTAPGGVLFLDLEKEPPGYNSTTGGVLYSDSYGWKIVGASDSIIYQNLTGVKSDPPETGWEDQDGNPCNVIVKRRASL